MKRPRPEAGEVWICDRDFEQTQMGGGYKRGEIIEVLGIEKFPGDAMYDLIKVRRIEKRNVTNKLVVYRFIGGIEPPFFIRTKQTPVERVKYQLRRALYG